MAKAQTTPDTPSSQGDNLTDFPLPYRRQKNTSDKDRIQFLEALLRHREQEYAHYDALEPALRDLIQQVKLTHFLFLHRDSQTPLYPHDPEDVLSDSIFKMREYTETLIEEHGVD